jgi:hypothetical protein
MKSLSVLILTLCIGGLPFAALPALADNLDDQGWHAFHFDGTGSQAYSKIDGSYEFFATGPTAIKVTDGYDTGDQFTLYDYGTLLGTSSYVPLKPGDGCYIPDMCYEDPLYSHGSWLVGPGLHEITIFMANSPWGGGDAWIESATPEPSSMILMGSGILGVIGVVRRRMLR